VVEVSPSKPAPQAKSSELLWEATFRNAPADVIVDSVERRTFLSVQPQSLKCCNAGRHQTFAARFFLGETPTLKQFGRNAEAAELDCHRRADQPSSRNKNVNHESAGCPFMLACPKYSLHGASRDAIY
jgi:hypothetical protein